MKTLLFILLSSVSYIASSQQDTVVNRKHYNTIMYYPYFDYKCSDTTKNNYVVGIGNMLDSTKIGEWKYYLSDGRILAKGKYKNGFKRGKWSYLSSKYGFIELIWDKSAMAKDFIQFDVDDKRPQIVDIVNTKEVSYKVVNGRTQNRPIFRFL